MIGNKRRHKYHVHKDNLRTMDVINGIVDDTGKSPFKPACWDMITIIAGFGRDKGCFMSLKSMAIEMGGRITERTLQSYEKYLYEQGIVSRFKTNVKGHTICIRRVKTPKSTHIESMKTFRKRIGQYQYETKNNPIFLSKRHEKFSLATRKICQERHEKFSPYIEKLTFKRIIKILTPKAPSIKVENDSRSEGLTSRPSDDCGVGIRRPQYETLRSRLNENVFSSQNESEDVMSQIPDPEPIRRKKKRPKNQTERRAEAIKKFNNGHIVNPLGGPDTRLRRMKWKLARDIGPSGSVTASQLYRHLVIKYQEALGIDIELQMPQGRDAVISWFDDLRQDFLKLCGHKATYRDLADYFEWMLDPVRLTKIIGVHKLGGGAAILKVQQFKGKIHIRTFYDTTLRRRNSDKPREFNPKILEQQNCMDEFQDICNTVSKEVGNPSGMVLCMARFGFPLVVQYMHDRLGMSEMTCRRSIIEIMATFISQSENTKGAQEYLNVALDASKTKDYLYNDVTMWKDWKLKTDGLIEESIAKYESNKNAK